VNWRDSLPKARGKLLIDEPLAPFTWLRVGGSAEVLFLPADEDDLAAFLRAMPAEIPVNVLGVGSNVIVRDGGVEGVVVRLAGRSFGEVHIESGQGRLVTGAGVPDAVLARAAAKAGIAGLEFFAGIPGSVGGALAMNAGCYGAETAEVLVLAWGVDRAGERRILGVADFAYGYRHSKAPGNIIWTGAIFTGHADEGSAIAARIGEITSRREVTQPIRERTGGSTFKNPPGHSAWRLVDEAGWRGRSRGGAMFSDLHANFLINTGAASAADLEDLGEAVRADVASKFGIDLEWEIKRIGKRG
jgi:UDP-N-acetylmuramate dehydrogenase